MANYLADVRGLIRDELRYLSDDFTDAELNASITQCLKEISKRSPRLVIEAKTTIANSKVIDITGLADLLYIEKAEYPIGDDPRTFVKVKEIDNETIELDTDTTPSAGGSGTLTGTVTFASGSAAVTGAATLFTTELAADYLIKKSTGTRWYRVYSVESATALTLAEPCLAADDGADVVTSTDYCYEAVYLYCRKLHSLTATVNSMDAELEAALIKGSVAYAALSWVTVWKTHIDEAVAKLDDVSSAIGDMVGRITQAEADLTSGRALINKVNIGFDPQSDYGNYASRELSNANAYLGKSGGYLRELSSRLSISGAINSYQTWANNKLSLYMRDLDSLTKPITKREYRK